MEEAEPQINEKDLLTIFKEFDKDNSGTIELSELKQITEQMGEKLTQKEMAKCMKEMDTNGDGKVTFPEFQYWWKFSKKGKMRKVVSLKFKGLKYLNMVGTKISSAEVNLKEKYTSELNTHELSVSFGHGPDNISIGLQLFIGGSQYKEQLQKIKTLVPEIDSKVLSVVLSFGTKAPEEKKHQFDSIVQQFQKDAQLRAQQGGGASEIFKLFTIKSHATADNLAIYATSLPDTPADEIIAGPKAQLEELGEDFTVKVSASVNLFGNITEAFAKEKFVKWLMHGFGVNYKIETNAVFLRKIRQIIEAQVSHDNVTQLVLTLIKFSKLNIKLKSPEDITKFFEDLGINELSEDSPTLKDLLGQFSEEMSLANWKDPTNVFHPIFNILQFLATNAQQEICLQVVLPFAIAKLRFRCIGGSSIFHNAFKVDLPS